MRLVDEKELKKIPRLSPTRFTREISARDMELGSSSQIGMLELHKGWNLVGWAPSADVAPRDMCPYVIMCERGGFRAWCHIATVSLELIIEIIEEDPSRVVPL
jgi:hypothetical protein